MARALAKTQPYAGRRPDRTVLNFTVDSEAAALLRAYAGGRKLGELVARLIHAHHARLQERQRLREKLVLVVNDAEE